MRILRLIAELTYDETRIHGDSKEDFQWFVQDVLHGDLALYSNEIGDEIGPIRIIGFEQKRR